MTLPSSRNQPGGDDLDHRPDGDADPVEDLEIEPVDNLNDAEGAKGGRYYSNACHTRN